MNSFASKSEKFLQILSDNKLWAAGLALFSACFWFVLNFYVNLPTEWLKFEEQSIAFKRYELEGKYVDQVYGAVIDSMDSAQNAQNAYFSLIDEIKATEKLPSDEKIAETQKIISEANAQLSLSIALLQSTIFYDSRLAGYPNEFASDLETYRPILTEMEQVLLAISSKDYVSAVEHIQAHAKALDYIPTYILKSRQKMESFGNTARSITQEDTNKIAVATAEIKKFYGRLAITFPAIGYMIYFSVKAGHIWKHPPKSYRRAKKKKSSTQKTG